MRFEKARISLLVGLLLLQTESVRAEKSGNHGPGSHPSTPPRSVNLGTGSNFPLPTFDTDQVKSITQNIAQTFHQHHPKNWIELQRTVGAVLVNPTSPRRLPKFDQAKVEKAVFQLANSVAAQSPDSWEDFGQILNGFTGVIPAAVMENIIAFQVLQREASERNQDKVEKANEAGQPGAGEESDGKGDGKSGEGLSPEAKEALDKRLDDNIGKFSGFDTPAKAFSPLAALTSPSTSAAGGADKKDPKSTAQDSRDAASKATPSPLNLFSTGPGNAPLNGPMIPVLSQNSPSFPNFPVDSPAGAASPSTTSQIEKSSEKSSSTSTSVLPGIDKPAPDNQLLSSLISQLTKNVQASSALPAAAVPQGAVAKAQAKAKEAQANRTNGTRLFSSGRGGGENFGEAGVGSNEESVARGAQGWLGTAEQWLKAALGLKDPEGSETESEEGKAHGLSDSGEFLAMGALADGPLGSKARSRVVASVADATGVSVGTAHRLYQGALYSAWGSTLGYLAFALRRFRKKRSK